MTDQHPLTNEHAVRIGNALHNGYEAGLDEMLDEVIKWLKNNLNDTCYINSCSDDGMILPSVNTYLVIENLLKAMHPQQQEES